MGGSPNLEAVLAAASRYREYVPLALQELDGMRFDEIPASLAARDSPHLEKQDLVDLMTWKLKHGTFRPALLNHIHKNDDADVKKQSEAAYAALGSRSERPSLENTRVALEALTRLHGVGPATASLGLSVFNPAFVPFFSDELYRLFLHCKEDGHVDWKARLAYSKAEYLDLFTTVSDVCSRSDLSALELEKGAWVLARDEGAGSGPKANPRVGSAQVNEKMGSGEKVSKESGRVQTASKGSSTAGDLSARKRSIGQSNTEVSVGPRRSKRRT